MNNLHSNWEKLLGRIGCDKEHVRAGSYLPSSTWAKGREEREGEAFWPSRGESTRKPAKGKAKSSDFALGSILEWVPDDESGRRGRRDGSAFLRGHQNLI